MSDSNLTSRDDLRIDDGFDGKPRAGGPGAGAGSPRATAPPIENLPARLIMGCVKAMVLTLTMAIWAIGGLVIWIPMITLAIVKFTAAIVGVTLSQESADGAGRDLERAVPFYLHGFKNIYNGVYPESSYSNTPYRHKLDQRRINIDLFQTIMFWSVVLGAVLLWTGRFDDFRDWFFPTAQ